nr:hypothetical protein [Lachnospiraceae bacterium]
DTMGKLSASQLVEGLIRCYKDFFKLPLKDVYSMNPNAIVRIAFLISLMILLYTLLKVWTSGKKLHLKVLVTAIMAVLPVAVDLISIMAISSGTMYSIMVYELVYVFVIPTACLTALPHDGGRLMKAADIAASVSLAAAVITYIWFANGNYLALEYTNIHDTEYFTVLMTQIKSAEGYREDMPVALVGSPLCDPANKRPAKIDKTFDIAGKSTTNVNAYSYWNIMTRVIGFDPVVRNSDEDEKYFRNLPEVDAMPVYPNAGSVKVIDDTVVVKFRDIEDIEE